MPLNDLAVTYDAPCRAHILLRIEDAPPGPRDLLVNVQGVGDNSPVWGIEDCQRGHLLILKESARLRKPC
jgi:hypothetical protein